MVELNIIYLLENYKTHFLFTIYYTSAFSTFFFLYLVKCEYFYPNIIHKIILFCAYNKILLELFMGKHFTGRVFILNYFIQKSMFSLYIFLLSFFKEKS